MPRATPLLFLLLVASCDQSPKPQAQQESPTPVGRWAIIGAAHPPTDRDGELTPAVWRLDTKTGRLDYCVDDGPNGIVCLPGEVPPQ